jgi:hypothetical protein
MVVGLHARAKMQEKMMDVLAILDRLSINYVERGPNVKQGNVNIHCPMCGDDDPSQHLGINIKTGAWGCWRNSMHRSKRFRFLLERLVGPSQAALILEDATTPPDGFEGAVASLKTDRPAPAFPQQIKWPEEARPIHRDGLTSRFSRYLSGRGFPAEEINDLCMHFGLRCALYGPFGGRVLFPIFNAKDEMIGWTGRAIVKAEVRYKAHPRGNIIKTSLFNLPAAMRGGQTLLVCEGPVDAMKVHWYASPSASAVALMGTLATPEQIGLLSRLAARYVRLVVLLDHDAREQALRLQRTLSFLHADIHLLKQGDPGDLTPGCVGRVICDAAKL